MTESFELFGIVILVLSAVVGGALAMAIVRAMSRLTQPSPAESDSSAPSAAPSSVRMGVSVVGLAVVFATYIYVYGVSVHAVMLCLLASVLLMVALIDLDSYTIPNVFVVGISLLFFVMVVTETVAGVSVNDVFAQVVDGLLGSLVVGGGMLLFSVVFDLVTGRMSLGGGDIKLLLAVNLFLGLKLSVFSLILTCVFGLIFAATTNIHKPESADAKFKQRVIPFGPSIALASVVSLIVGPFLLTWLAVL